MTSLRDFSVGSSIASSAFTEVHILLVIWLLRKKHQHQQKRVHARYMIEGSYSSVVVSMILNGRSLLLMHVGIRAAILGSATAVAVAAAAGSKDDDTLLHFPRT